MVFALGAMLIVFAVCHVRLNPCMFFIPVILLQVYIFCVDLPSLLCMYSAAVSAPVLCHLGAMSNPTMKPATAIVHWIVIDTQPME